ncbi:3-hydroxyacyl-CoA dehydrogenase [Arthrobacter sp. GAS37]|uniref:3-hydroxyacyl-CoA dehydrogenase family protein n=1 Tax=Arthrobacter sp. GAS37 TaxID=3156261 RepID=UPI0038393407
MDFDNVVETQLSAAQRRDVLNARHVMPAAYAEQLLREESGIFANTSFEPQTIRCVGVIGAGLMAGQLAILFARRLRVPVLITDVSQARIDHCLAWIATHLDKLQGRGHLNEATAAELRALFRGTLDRKDFGSCDVVIEAVIEDLGVKRTVLSEIEKFVSTEALLLTNTSSLSLASMGEQLAHRERLVGMHFFNPVAVLPLVEVIRTAENDAPTLARVGDLARLLGKTPVLVEDTPGFVVNRILTRLFSELLRLIDAGFDIKTVDHALDPLDLPMTPLTLLGFIGPAVQRHICESMHAAYPGRFGVSPGLVAAAEAGLSGFLDASGVLLPEAKALLQPSNVDSASMTADAAGIGALVLEALAEEVGLILAEKVVASPKEIDLCMILGANFPKRHGGLTPLLDLSGASRKVWGKNLHESPGFAEEAASSVGSTQAVST